LASKIFANPDTEKGCICCVCYEEKEMLLQVHRQKYEIFKKYESFKEDEKIKVNEVSMEQLDKIIKGNLQYRSHVACEQCLGDWFISKEKEECPACRQKVEKKLIHELIGQLRHKK
jgi:hypothetical protein